MAYTTPTTKSSGQGVSSAEWNALANDISFLAGTQAAETGAGGTTSSTTFADLATVGPTVSLETGAKALVLLSSVSDHPTVGAYTVMSFAVSGATTLAAADGRAVYRQQWVASSEGMISGFVVLTTLTPGVNTFTAKYRVDGGTGTFLWRRLAVIPLT